MAIPPRSKEHGANHDHFLFEILDEKLMVFRVIDGLLPSNPMGCSKWVAVHSNVLFHICLSISPAAWKTHRCNSLTAVLWVDKNRPTYSELWKPLSPHADAVHTWHNNTFGKNPRDQDGYILVRLWAGTPKNLVATLSRKYNTI